MVSSSNSLKNSPAYYYLLNFENALFVKNIYKQQAILNECFEIINLWKKLARRMGSNSIWLFFNVLTYCKFCSENLIIETFINYLTYE